MGESVEGKLQEFKLPEEKVLPLGGVAEAVHEIVRALHDGECPKCHELFKSFQTVVPKPVTFSKGLPREDEKCPSCGFTITREEIKAALKEFAPVMEKNLEVFEEWRKGRKGGRSEAIPTNL